MNHNSFRLFFPIEVKVLLTPLVANLKLPKIVYDYISDPYILYDLLEPCNIPPLLDYKLVSQ